MRRRRQKNPLLLKIVAISILVHIVALPVLAHFGAFKKIEKGFRQTIEAQLVKLPPPERIKEEVKKPQHTAKRIAPTARHSASSAPRTHVAAHTNVNAPKVVASAGGPSGGDAGDTVEQGSGKAGVVPTPLPNPTPHPDTTPQPQPAPQPAPQPQPQPAPPKPQPPVEPPKPVPAPQPRPAPVLTDAAPLPDQSPQPSIPDDLRADALDKTCVAEFDVGADGVPTDVRIAQSSGIDELDRIALDTARKWRFKPATRDGQPVQSVVRLHIEFQVS